MRYNKPALTFDQQYDLLLDRGLIIPDRLRAQRWLRHISYYRFSAYFVPFKVANDQFATGTTFDQVAGSYIFDRKLRLILMDAIERLEVALRTGLTYGISHQYGPFGHVNPLNFDARFDHEEFMEELAQAEDQSHQVLVIIRHALVRTWPQCRWRERLFELFDQHPSTDLAAMQIPTDWRSVPPWTGDL